MLAVPAQAAGTRPEQVAGTWNARLLGSGRYVAPLRAARRVLERQSGLVELRRDLPTVVIPDLHGRRDYLDAVLRTRDPVSGSTYGQLLRRGQVQVVCLGDVMHTESRGAQWRRGMTEAAMRAEMAESLGTLKRIAELKAAHPDTFHLLRGNHDDVGPCGTGPCDLPRQIALTRRFVADRLGQQTVDELSRFFSALPTAARGSGFVAAHAAPMFPVSRAEVERGSDRALASLARSRVPGFNRLRRAERGRSPNALQQVAGALGADPARDLYIHGHLWASPMTIHGQEVYFGHPRDRTFLRLDPAGAQPWSQLFEAGTGRRVPVRRPR